VPKQDRVGLQRPASVAENALAAAAARDHHGTRRQDIVTNEPTPDTTTGNAEPSSGATSIEHNKAVSRRWIEVFNQRDDAGEADVRGPEYVAHAPASLEPGPLDSEAWTRFLSGFVDG